MVVSSPRSTLTLNVYQTALAAIRVGISCIPILADGTKSPAVRWKEYQKKIPTPGEARQWFYGKNRGIAFITGEISGWLEMLDFDSREVYEQFVQRTRREGLTSLLERVEQGYKESSQRPLKEPPYMLNLIETRGEAGYSIGAPSCGKVHPSRQPYRVMQGSLATIETLVPEERALLLSVARTLDEVPTPSKDTHERKKVFEGSNEGRRPGTIFNERATWPEILEPHGWTWIKSIGVEDFWRRPGKDIGISSTTNYEGSDYLYVFSTSTLFEPRVGISKFAAYTLLNHGGDFSAATKALVAQGYVEAETA
jgi:hypothetical protein